MDDEQSCGHRSDCAVHNEPYAEPGPCDCGAERLADSEPREDED
jgi:hypothetical protein